MAGTRPWQLTVVITVGVFESLGSLVYGLLLLVSSLTDGTSGATGSDVSPWVLFAAYVGFAALIALVVRNLWRGMASARTAFLLTQAFALVVAQTLVGGGVVAEQVLGWCFIAIAVAGAAAILSRPVSKALR